ncbi:MAG TPA: tripartite tricarboxylate transporter TctB family protein [Xanthobacteraceae bacterium]|nr:tripartite tricarboxylate transporter TctB family protein [Xanthobacteraceae bacterium]
MTGSFGGAGWAARLRPALGEIVIAAGVLVLAAVIFWQTLSIPVSPIYAKVGPTVMPMITAAGLAILGILLMVEALQGGWRTEEEKNVTPDRVALLWIAAGLVLNVLLIGPAGFTIASVILFVCVARGFGSKAILRDAAIGAAFALVAYFGFAQTLGINIGAGIVESAIERIFGLGQGS